MNHESAKAASQIELLRDPNEPRKLSSEESQQMRQSPKVLKLATVRDQLRAQIEAKFGVVKMTEGELIHHDYQAVW